MTALAPHLASFLREHLPKERRASQHTCEAYAQCFQLLLCFAADQRKIKPAKIEIERLDAPLILAFLTHLEKKRGNSARTRNARLAAINSFFRYLEYRVPSCLDQSRRIHAIPVKKTDQVLVSYLTREELQALLDAPDAHIVSGIRDRAMLHLAFAAGMRVSELVGLRLDQIDRQSMSSVHIIGKGRRERVLPLWKETAAAIRAWLRVRPASSAPELFLNARAEAMPDRASNTSSRSTSPPPLATLIRSPKNGSVRMFCAIPVRCIPCRRRATFGRSRCGLATPSCRARRSICAPIRQRNSKRLLQWLRRCSSLAVSEHRTNYWPCLLRLDASLLMRSDTDEKTAAGRSFSPRTPHNHKLLITFVMRRTA